MDTTEAIIKTKSYIKVIESFLDCEMVYLFGSYLEGKQRDDSDIDIALFVKTLGEDYPSIIKKLYRARRDVDPRIEPHLFTDNSDPSGFSEEVKRVGLRVQ